MLRIVYNQSATVCRFANRIDELMAKERQLRGIIKNYKDMERLEKETRDAIEDTEARKSKARQE